MDTCMVCGKDLSDFYCYNCGKIDPSYNDRIIWPQSGSAPIYKHPEITGAILDARLDMIYYDIVFTDSDIILVYLVHMPWENTAGLQIFVTDPIQRSRKKRKRGNFTTYSPAQLIKAYKDNVGIPYMYVESVRLKRSPIHAPRLTLKYSGNKVSFWIQKDEVEYAAILINHYLALKISG